MKPSAHDAEIAALKAELASARAAAIEECAKLAESFGGTANLVNQLRNLADPKSEYDNPYPAWKMVDGQIQPTGVTLAPCSFEKCQEPAYRKGYCWIHHTYFIRCLVCKKEIGKHSPEEVEICVAGALPNTAKEPTNGNDSL